MYTRYEENGMEYVKLEKGLGGKAGFIYTRKSEKSNSRSIYINEGYK